MKEPRSTGSSNASEQLRRYCPRAGSSQQLVQYVFSSTLIDHCYSCDKPAYNCNKTLGG
jgi:hypothetical protein